MNNIYAHIQYKDIANTLKEQLKTVRTEVGDSDEHNANIAEIVARHWNGGKAEAIQLSHHIVKNPVNAKKKGN